MNSKLKKYTEKRDFSKTPEPKPKISKEHKNPSFVIQKHDATRLHYDLRLEIDGVLVSWAIPKGPSLDPAEKRLAVRTEDHPMAYADFEGVIPEGQYGGGTVMVWDNGTYENIKEKSNKVIPIEKCLKDGHIDVIFNGKKIKGAFALVRTKMKIGSSQDKETWLLIKKDDEYASKKKNPVSTENKSVLTDRTMSQIEKSGDVYDG
ncbi:DNA ligase [candidate division TM6 bacterium RIFCSPHIGHO2_12_FULL_32_22]|nr:MAG: DNA ligase [candidate division TM6 bacterium RIFCSPHIGHO2_12_FULL_32_22]